MSREEWNASTNRGPHNLTSGVGEGRGWGVQEECPWLRGRGHSEEVGEVVHPFPQVEGVGGILGNWGRQGGRDTITKRLQQRVLFAII